MPDLRVILEKELLPLVEKPMRYIGNELNSIKKDLETISLHGVLCFPEIYDIGMSHYGSQILYHIVNKYEQWALSRCYHPWIDAEKIMREKQIPLYSHEYFMPVSSADWLGFSIQYELQYTNVINMLDLANIPKQSSERGENDPVIIAGGPCMGNIEPIADFLDACVIGDGEEAIVALCKILDRLKQKKASRQEKMQALSEIDGVYVPQFYQVSKKGLFLVPESPSDLSHAKATRVTKLSDDYYPVKPIVPLVNVVHNRLAVEVMRGCTRGCRFCSAGVYYRPIRERSVSSIISQISEGLKSTGYEGIGLLSLSTADYSCFGLLMYEMGKLGQTLHMRVSLPSTRIDALTDKQFHMLNTVSSATSFTIAPEAGSQRLRNVINKDFTEELIINTVNTLLESNIQTLKLYFMIGLPTETEEDIQAIISLVSKISDAVRAKSKRRMIHVAVSPFSPKPHTPFQWEAMDSIQMLFKKGRAIKLAMKSRRNVKVSYRDPGMTFLETVLARGDRSLSVVVMKVWEKGARFDGWDDQFRLSLWEEAAEEIGVSFDTFVQEIPEDQELPWSVIDTGINKEFLISERRKSLQGIATEDCRRNKCMQCGVCTTYAPDIVCESKEFVHEHTNDSDVTQSDKSKTREQYRHRIEYSKGYEVRFMSHINLVNIFQQALRMANVPLAYSHGFHPHPCMAFGPPLALGIMGDSELFDMITTDQTVLDASLINTFLPEGLCIKKISMLIKKPQSLNTAVVAAQYTIIPVIPISSPEFSQIVNTLLKQKSLWITVEKKGRHNKIDIKPLVYDLTVKENNGCMGIEAVLSAQASKTCRPRDLISCLFPGKGLADFLVTRRACLRDDNGILKKNEVVM